MTAGLVLAWYRYPIEVNLTASVARSGTTTGTTGLAAGTTPLDYTIAQDVPFQRFGHVGARIEQDDTGAYTRFWNFSVGVTDDEVSAAGNGTVQSTLEFEEVLVYIVEFLGTFVWLVVWSDAKWYRDGGLDRSLGAGSAYGLNLAPSGCPMLGVPPGPGVSCAANPSITLATIDEIETAVATQEHAPAYDYTVRTVEDAVHEIEDPFGVSIIAPYQLSAHKHSYDYPFGNGSVTVTASVVGGWRFKAESGGSYIEPDVLVLPVAGPLTTPGTCDCTPGFPSVGGTNTFDLTATAYHKLSVDGATAFIENRASQVWGFPNYVKALNRMNTGYRALIERFMMLGASHQQTAVCGTSDSDPSVCDVALSNFFPQNVTGGSGNTTGFLYHTIEALANYVNFNCSPLWSYLVYFPKDDQGGGYDWEIDGSAERPSEYFLPLREQHITHPDLPPASRGDDENALTRNSIVSEPLMSGAMALWHDAIHDRQSSFWGISRFDKMSYTVPATFTYTSSHSGLFSAVDATLAFGADVTVTLDPGKTSCVVKVALSSFAAAPYYLPQIADKIATEWSNGSAAVVSVGVYLENEYGDKVLLTTVSSATGVKRTDDKNTDSKYAGSWAQDFGAGIVTDTGTDSQAEGDSANVLVNEEQVETFKLLTGFGAKFLRYEIVVDTAAGTMHIKYPVLTMPVASPSVVAENSNWSAILWPNGPGIRWSQWYWFDGFNVVTPPLVSLYGLDPSPVGAYKPSALDALAFKRIMLEGTAASDANLVSDMATYYGSDEAVTSEDLDTHTLAFVVPDPLSAAIAGIHLLVNTWREVPPCIGVPVPARDVDYDRDLEDWGLQSWSFIKSRRDIVFRSGANIELVDPDTSEVWTTVENLASGWKTAYHDHAVDGTEHATFQLIGSIEYALVSPWHGYFALLIGGSEQKHPTNYQMPQGHYHRATSVDGNLDFRQVDWSAPDDGFDVVSAPSETGDDTYPSIMHDPLTQSVYLVFQREDPAGTFVSYYQVSDDDGKTWGSAVSLGSWKYPRVASSPDGTLVFMGFKYVSGSSGPGNIWKRVQKPGETSPSAEGRITNGATNIQFADEIFDIVKAHDGSDRWVLVARPDGSSDVSEYHSYDDCVTFEVI